MVRGDACWKHHDALTTCAFLVAFASASILPKTPTSLILSPPGAPAPTFGPPIILLLVFTCCLPFPDLLLPDKILSFFSFTAEECLWWWASLSLLDIETDLGLGRAFLIIACVIAD